MTFKIVRPQKLMRHNLMRSTKSQTRFYIYYRLHIIQCFPCKVYVLNKGIADYVHSITKFVLL